MKIEQENNYWCYRDQPAINIKYLKFFNIGNYHNSHYITFNLTEKCSTSWYFKDVKERDIVFELLVQIVGNDLSKNIIKD